MRLENKVALIPCAHDGMGRESARLFAKEGAAVVLAGRKALNTLKGLNQKRLFITAATIVFFVKGVS